MPSLADARTLPPRPRRRFEVLVDGFRYRGVKYAAGDTVVEADDPFEDPAYTGTVRETPGGTRLQPFFVDDLGNRWRLTSSGPAGRAEAALVTPEMGDWVNPIRRGLIRELGRKGA